MTNPQIPRTLGKMNTTIDRVFRRTPEGFYREVFLHFLNFLNEDGTIRSQKLDKEEHRDLWKIAREDERSAYGECDWFFPGQEKAIRLVCIKKG